MDDKSNSIGKFDKYWAIGAGALFLVIIFLAYNSANKSSPLASATPQSTTDQSSQIQELQNQIDQLKNQKPQVIIKNVPQNTSQSSIATIIKQWEPVIVYIECSWKGQDNNVNYITGGSGVAGGINSQTGDMNIYTNKHVIKLSQAPYTLADFCKVKFLHDDNVFLIPQLGFFDKTGSDLDFAVLRISNPDNYLKDLYATTQNQKYCYTLAGGKSVVNVGDEVIILGYPSIGSATGITATEGIISGMDGDYFITSAKIDHGNSGGAAILVKESCYIGIPSFVKAGSLESLGRILSLDAI